MTLASPTSDLAGRRTSAIAPDEAADSPPVAPYDLPVRTLTVLIAVPTLQGGAADAGVLGLVRILSAAGHRAIVASRGGHLSADVREAGGECVTLDMASRNPVTMLRNTMALARLVRERGCDIVHAHGRAPAWCAHFAARITGIPFLTTWYKGFREQNAFKRAYNRIMARGDRVIAVSDQLADLINERYGTPFDRIVVVPANIDLSRFDPASVSDERVQAVRRAWGVADDARVILAVGRMRHRKGHHVMVRAVARLKAMGLKDFVCVFAAEDQGTRYAAELWDGVLAADCNDVVRMTGPLSDPPAAYAAAAAVVSAAVQPEGQQRALLEAQAMERPVVVSDAAAGGDVVLTPPAVGDDRITGLRFATGDDAALAAVLIRLFSMPESGRRAMGQRGRAWVLHHFGADTTAEQTLRLYADVAGGAKAA